MNWETIWTFNTDNFEVRLSVAPEESPPEDTFEFPEDIAAVHNGDVAYFCAKVSVHKGEYEIGADYLGCCAYYSVDEFYTSHRDADPMNRNSSIMRAERGENVVICHYFPDMVRGAIAEARATLQY